MDNIFITCNVDPHLNITEIAGIRTNGVIGKLHKRSVLGAFTTKVDKNLSKMVDALKAKLDTDNERFVIVGINNELLTTALRKENCSIFPNRIWIDLTQIAWPLLFSHQINNRMLKTMAEHFKISYPNNPDTADDCSVLAQVYGLIMQRYNSALAGEETVRDLGGEVLENIRQIIGF